MSGKMIMAAMGNIDNAYIMEFAQVKPIKKHRSAMLARILPVAACFSIIIMSVVFFMQSNDMPYGNLENPSAGNVIWGDGVGDNIVDDYSEQAAKGTIIIAESLKTAMTNSNNNRDLFAVLVTEMSDLSRDDVYNTIIKPLNIDEEYMETGVIFISEDQIDSMECPSNYALVLSLAVKPYEDRPINQETLDAVEGKKIKVKVYLKYNVEDTLAQYQNQLKGLNDEEYQKMQQSIIKKEVRKMVSAFITDYKITNESIDGIGIYIPQFTAELDTALIANIIEDGRVDIVLEGTDSTGLDQIQ